MAEQAFVTAVLVTHDGATWLPKVIAALGSQTHKIDRVIAVDTGSVDNSTKLLKSAGIPFFAEDREMGYGDAIEHALELTPPISNTSETQEWIWLIHDDCAPDKDALEELLAAIKINLSEQGSFAVLLPYHRSDYFISLCLNENFLSAPKLNEAMELSGTISFSSSLCHPIPSVPS